MSYNEEVNLNRVKQDYKGKYVEANSPVSISDGLWNNPTKISISQQPKSNEETEKGNEMNISAKESLNQLSQEDIQPTYASIVKNDKRKQSSRHMHFESESMTRKQNIQDMAVSEETDCNVIRQKAECKHDSTNYKLRKSDRLQKNPLGVRML